MKKILLLSINLVSFFLNATALTGSVSTFQNEIGTNDTLSDALATCIQKTFDGGYITTGYISNFGAGNDDIYLVKTDSLGNILWTKTYGDSINDDANYVVQTMDSGYAITGVTHSFNGENIFLIKTDQTGTILWSSVYGTGDSLSDASAASMQQTMDSGYIITGYISNYGAGDDDYYLVKTDATGNLLWAKTYGGTRLDDANSVIQTSDSGYIMAGISNSFADTIGDIYVVKTNSLGDTMWTKSYGVNLTDASDDAYSIRETSGHGFIIAGVSISNSTGEFGQLIKTDSLGNIVWSHLYSGASVGSDVSFSSVQQTTDSGYVVTGYTANAGGGDDDYLLIKLNSNGDTLWTRTYGSNKIDDGNYVVETNDGGYIMTGVTIGFATGGEHIYLVKTDNAGHSGCNEYSSSYSYPGIAINTFSDNTQVANGGVATVVTMISNTGGVALDACLNNGTEELAGSQFSATVYPNPFTGQTKVQITSNAGGENVIRIFDMQGKQVKNVITHFSNEYTLDCSDLQQGIYYMQVNSGDKLYGTRLIISK